MIPQIESMKTKRIEVIEANYNNLDAVVTKLITMGEDVKLDQNNGVFLVELDTTHSLLIGITSETNVVSITTTESGKPVAELRISSNGECEEHYRKFENTEMKRKVQAMFNILSDPTTTDELDKSHVETPEPEKPTPTPSPVASDGTEVEVVE